MKKIHKLILGIISVFVGVELFVLGMVIFYTCSKNQFSYHSNIFDWNVFLSVNGVMFGFALIIFLIYNGIDLVFKGMRK